MRPLLFILLLAAALPAQTTNHLHSSRSAYLQRASTQPVDWRPLDQAALDLAKKLDRPLLVDVGATWCVWCTRMDRDSYTQPGIADFINTHFIAVKVDYDQNPKLTAELQRAAALQNQPSGVPLTLFVTPQQFLYAGGTYYPAGKFQLAFEAAARQYREPRSTLEKDSTRLILIPEKLP